MTTQIKAGVIAANAITASELASSALSGGSFTGDVTFDTNTLVIDSSNNRVGINIASPYRPLDVYTSATGQVPVANFGTSGAGGQGLILGINTTTETTYLQNNTNASYDMEFIVNASQRLLIKSNGNIGIGTSSPTGKLEIAATGTNAAPHIKLVESGDTREFNIYNDGSGNGRLVLADTDDTPDTEIVLADNGVIQFKTANTERATIDATGNVGIGVTNPQYALDISGGLQFTGASKLTDGYWLCDASHGFRINKSDDSANNFIVRNDGLTWNKDDLLVGKSSYSDIGAQNARLDVSHNAACIAQFDTTSPNGGYIAISVSDSSKGFIGTGSNIGASNTSDLVVRAATGDLHFKTDQNGTDAIVELANDTATNIHNGIKIYNSTDRNNYTRYFHIGRRNVSSAGLLAYYDPNNSHCDDNSGSSIIDLSGNGYTLTKASTFTHQSVSARSYWVGDGGTNAYAGGSVPLTAYAPIHLSLWVIWEDVNNFNGGYQLNGWQGANSYCYIGGQKEGTSSASWLYGYVGNGTNIPSDQSSSTNRNSTVNSDEWVYLTIQAGWTNSSQGSRTTGRTEVYLNGTLVDSKASQQMAQASSTNFFLGKLSGGYQINGAIGPAVVYKRTLTQAEILDNMRVHQELYMI